MGVTVEGDLVRLRDVTLEDADLLDDWSRVEAKGSFNDFGMPRSATDREALARGPLRNERNGELIIERLADGCPIGSVSWHLERYGPNAESGAWNIGIALIPEARGHGHGTEAQRLAADYLFAATTLHRVEASTDVDNLAEQRSLEKAGFTREGILRGAQFRAGEWHDLVNYARLRTD
ncbi:MAG TPA: GNAT family protein [Candidatus Limnocylindrales bacterium]|nr:GNAT family protein [Candidatus Limnocylindrales bacterium]